MKKIFFFTAIAFFTLSSCKKEATLTAEDDSLAQSLSTQSARDVQALQANSRPTEVTFILIRGALSISGAIQASGKYTMNPVKQTGQAFHCTNNLTLSDGTITALTNCYDGSTGTWRIISGTGAYANLQGNGRLVMYPGGETWTGKIF